MEGNSEPHTAKLISKHRIAADQAPCFGICATKEFKKERNSQKLRENIRMGKIAPFEDEEEANLYIINENRSSRLHKCPFCTEMVQHVGKE